MAKILSNKEKAAAKATVALASTGKTNVAVAVGAQPNGLYTPEQFVKRAIAKLRGIDKATGKEWKGMHTVFSGFNQAWRDYFGDDPVAGVKALVAEGKVVSIPAYKGARLYMPDDAPARRETSEEKGARALATILAD